MAQLVMLIYLRNDRANTLEKRIEYMQKSEGFPSLERRDGVTLLSDNAIVFDQTKSHGIYVKLCAELLKLNLPYLLVPIESTAAWLAAGELPPATRASLEKLAVAILD